MLVPARASLAFVSCCIAAALASGCGGSPTSPSTFAGAVIAGTVVAGQGHSGSTSVSRPASWTAAAPPAVGLTVRLLGTSRSAVVDGSGGFELRGVPAGNARLQFTGEGVDSTIDVVDVRREQFIQITVQVNGSVVVALDEARSGKVQLCHASDTGTYQLIEVSESAEPAHRAHGDGAVGESVPGQPEAVFGTNCRVVGPSIDIQKLTNDQDADVAPGPRIPVGSPVNWRYVVTNNGSVDLSAIAVVDDQGVVVDCSGRTQLSQGESMTCTGSGLVTEIGPYRNVGTATAQWSTLTGRSGVVTDSDASHYLGISPITIEKLTNGEEADTPPGPSILIGSPVTWEYRLTNIGVVPLTGIVVVDDRGVVVDCAGQTTLAPGAIFTCTGSGVAIEGPYSNTGTVTANWASGQFSGTVTSSDLSHYVGVTDLDGPKVTLCHRTGAGFFVVITVGIAAEPAHLAHGDGKPGEAVPGQAGRVFGASCSVQ